MNHYSHRITTSFVIIPVVRTSSKEVIQLTKSVSSIPSICPIFFVIRVHVLSTNTNSTTALVKDWTKDFYLLSNFYFWIFVWRSGVWISPKIFNTAPTFTQRLNDDAPHSINSMLSFNISFHIRDHPNWQQNTTRRCYDVGEP